MKIDLQYDGQIKIAVGQSADSKVWKNTNMQWSTFLKKVSEPVRTKEKFAEYLKLSKSDQGSAKDVGGFVGGILNKGSRKKTSVLCRKLITLDVDFSYEDFWWDFTMLYGCAACIYSTHSSSPTKPRHRLIIPLDREVTIEEHEAIARKIAGAMNIDLFDQSTFESNRLMFWPSVSLDADYYFEYQDSQWLCADDILESYNNWHDTEEWPYGSSYDEAIKRSISKQEDPTKKKGIVGIFCRTYPISDAIEKFLPDIYEKISDNRYTYILGSTAGGLILYDDLFAYSHHGTDPAGGRLCNAFDLVRIHKFRHLDSGREKEEKDCKSFKAMEQFALEDEQTKLTLGCERLSSAKTDFNNGYVASEEKEQSAEVDDITWMTKLDATVKGTYDNSAGNINLIIKNDSLIKDAFMLNTFDNKRYCIRDLPWRKLQHGPEPMRDVDYSGIRNYIECTYGITSTYKIDDSIALDVEKHSFHPIVDYLSKLKWDGIPRVDTLLIDYFGAEDTPYTRAAIRKALCAAVARVFYPGTKYDMVLVIVGEQGTYKSTFIRKLGMDWFSDTFSTFAGKESFEQLQGAWLIEMAELSGLKKAEIEQVKQYISKNEDQFRPAYGRTVETYKRQCVFFGTTNNADFLSDPTGNRRFNPVDVHFGDRTKNVPDMTQDDIDQIWAEAKIMFERGEKLYFDKDESTIARELQMQHSEVDERRGIVEKYVNTLFPSDWDEKDLYDRRAWLDDPLAKAGTVQKDVVCTAEIWCECLGKDRTDMSRYNTREINNIMTSLTDWEFISSTRTFKIYGKQKYYKRKDSLL